MEALDMMVIPLLDWYRENARDLPWRHTEDPYKILLSEVMLQQTRVAAVLDYYRRFLAAAPTAADLAGLEEDALLKLWQGLGYYNRARNLQKAAQAVTWAYGGRFPDTYEGLLALPGVGEYTAGAVASIAFGRCEAAVDGNVLRVVTRLTADPADVTRPETRRRIAAALKQVMPSAAPGRFNQAVMELGATVCLPNGAPQCGRCPLAAWCEARAREDFSFPVKPPKKGRRVEERTVYLIFSPEGVALRRRPDKGLLAGLWEYPNQPAPWACPVPGQAEYAGQGKHIFTHIEWHMTAYTVQAGSQALPQGWVWATRAELAGRYSVPSAFAPFQPVVEQYLSPVPAGFPVTLKQTEKVE